MQQKEKIGRRIARAGICSRRAAERLVTDGRVKINGKIVKNPAERVTAEDKIIVNGKILPQKEPARLWRYYKPVGLITSNSDEKGRATIFDTFPEDLPRTMTVGRLDMNTEGLLLLTNDGDLARYMELPKTAWARRYRVRVYGYVNEKDLKALKKGIEIDGIKYKNIKAEIDKSALIESKENSKNIWLNITLIEGKNREIRRVMEHLGLKVNRLIRISYGPFQLGNMKKGDIIEVSKKSLKSSISKEMAEKLL